MSDKKYDLIVYIGRFQPAHNGHIKTIEHALDISRRVLVLVGSANQPRTPKNPFTFEERRDMIATSVSDPSMLSVDSIEDNKYKMDDWIKEVQNKVYHSILDYFHGKPKNAKVAIIGHMKDGSSNYLKFFPQWDFIETGIHLGTVLHSTDIRENIFEEKIDYLKGVVPSYVNAFIEGFLVWDVFEELKKEYEFLKDYDPREFPRNEVTADAVVIQSGHILLIERKFIPGKGLLALPGGFVSPDETVEDAMIRELKEETNLRVPEKVLRGSIKTKEVFDDPGRSDRGRIITHAFHVHLDDSESLPRVSGGDDAAGAHWVPISQIKPEEMYSDHWSIIEYFV
jgi:bifunctional NMN adenylyltransferase/nudix hydrolase